MNRDLRCFSNGKSFSIKVGRGAVSRTARRVKLTRYDGCDGRSMDSFDVTRYVGTYTGYNCNYHRYNFVVILVINGRANTR